MNRRPAAVTAKPAAQNAAVVAPDARLERLFDGGFYWRDGKQARLFHVTQGYRLVQLDAATGRPVATFGKDGIVDLFQDLDRKSIQKSGTIGWNSPPLVVAR